MTRLLDYLSRNILVGDGAMGTMLQQKGMPGGVSPELWMAEHPEDVREIHEAYFLAGARMIQTNTFGATRAKLKEYQAGHLVEAINRQAVSLARQAVGDRGWVAGTVGPSGLFLPPLGRATFQELFDLYREQIKALAAGGADLILIETMSDLGEARIAVLAAKDCCRLPVACTLTFSEGRTLTGTDPATAAAVLEALGVDILGANCSTGSAQLLPVMREMASVAGIPLMVQPNAGLPGIDGIADGYEPPGAMADYAREFVQLGVNIMGSCCGSTPEHTRALAGELARWRPVAHNVTPKLRLCSRQRMVTIDSGELPVVIGERINPTARKDLAGALAREDWNFLLQEARSQVEAGAHVLDVNLGIPGLDEARAMEQAASFLTAQVVAPLTIDSANPQALEVGLQNVVGRALVNSVNGKEGSLHTVLPLVKKYGAAVIALTLDEEGIAYQANHKLAIARKILEVAGEYGLGPQDVLLDHLVMTAAANPAAPLETLAAVTRTRRELGVGTVLGISNVSHGLPQRPLLNRYFLSMAVAAGLDAAIANPLDHGMWEGVRAGAVVSGRDEGARSFIQWSQGKERVEQITPEKEGNGHPGSRLLQAVVEGQKGEVKGLVSQLLQDGLKPLDIIQKHLVPALDQVGEDYGQGRIFLPQLVLAAESAQEGFDLLLAQGGLTEESSLATVVLGTVEGDIHDIGKNIVKMLLKNAGFKVIDLGKNIPASQFISAVEENQAEILGLSALMTTTAGEMEKVIQRAREKGLAVKVMVGGAVITPEYASRIGADGYSADAVEAVKVAKELVGSGPQAG